MKWSEVQVGQWLDWAVHEFGFNQINKTNWQLSGLQLCALSKEEFLEKAPPYIGDVLHSHLNLLKAKGNQQLGHPSAIEDLAVLCPLIVDITFVCKCGRG